MLLANAEVLRTLLLAYAEVLRTLLLATAETLSTWWGAAGVRGGDEDVVGCCWRSQRH